MEYTASTFRRHIGRPERPRRVGLASAMSRMIDHGMPAGYDFLA